MPREQKADKWQEEDRQLSFKDFSKIQVFEKGDKNQICFRAETKTTLKSWNAVPFGPESIIFSFAV